MMFSLDFGRKNSDRKTGLWMVGWCVGEWRVLLQLKRWEDALQQGTPQVQPAAEFCWALALAGAVDHIGGLAAEPARVRQISVHLQHRRDYRRPDMPTIKDARRQRVVKNGCDLGGSPFRSIANFARQH